MKRSLTLISLILALCVLLPGWAALAEDEGVQYFNASEVRFGTITDYKTIKNSSSSWYDLSSGWYVVEGNVSLSSKTTLRVTGDVHLILCDGSTLTVGDGVYIKDGSSLSIYGQIWGTGKLVAKPKSGPGIGGMNNTRGGNLYIHRCVIDAKGGTNAAGIGGGNHDSGYGDIVIYGGTVTAQGGSSGAGIGKGQQNSPSKCGSIQIYGGTVNATGGDYGAGIGGGEDRDGGSITIYGGYINATGGKDGAGIGGGEGGSGGTIAIHGGTVEASSKGQGAGVGGGEDGNSGTITIDGGTVDATGGKNGAGIGGGERGNGQTITIRGGSINAYGKDGGAGVGGGSDGNGGTITIGRGRITGEAADGAGIGGGKGAGAGTITIESGSIDAGSDTGAGIGSGKGSGRGIITIKGGTINARSRVDGAAIGGGYDEDFIGNITISGGSVTAKAKDGAGIGAGNSANFKGTININGNVYAEADWGAAIGAGCEGSFGDGGECSGDIHILGGSVTAVSGADRVYPISMAIGCGHNGSESGNVSVYLNAEVKGGYDAKRSRPYGWSERVDGCHQAYAVITPGHAWIIGFKANGGTGEMAKGEPEADGKYIVPENGFTAPEGQVFAGWKLGEEEVKPGDEVTVTTESDLVAQWRAAVVFDANGASGEMEAGIPGSDDSYILPDCGFTAPEGMEFAGWKIGNDILQPGEVILVGNGVVAVAQWQPIGGATEAGVAYVDANGSTKTTASATAITNQTRWNTGWYVVNGNVTIGNQIEVNGNVRLILADGARLTARGGILVFSGNTLTIYGQSAGTGALDATGAGINVSLYLSAGIGGSSGRDAGTIIINGGRITAKGGYHRGYGPEGGSGIGAGMSASGGTIIINGGTVNAEAGCGAGIGGGNGNVTINGGTVTATGAYGGAGIGGANTSGNSGKITINGGTVTATGSANSHGHGSAGIGAGAHGVGNTTTINGGTVTATGYLGGAGIGGGHYHTDWNIGGTCGRITITGGTVTATADGSGAGIGAGAHAKSGTVTITGGKVNASSTSLGAGIGGGHGVDGGTVVITGGTVEAWSARSGAGIGGGQEANGGNVEIKGGTVVAEGTRAIGRGEGGSDDGTLDVYDDAQVTAGDSSESSTLQSGAERVEACRQKYAKIQPAQIYAVLFDANGGEGEMELAETDGLGNYTLPECGFTAPEGMEFAGWLFGEVMKQPGDIINLTDETTLVAQWQEYVGPTIAFDANGGTGEMDAAQPDEEGHYTLPECGFTAPEGMEFASWKVGDDTLQPGEVILVDKSARAIAQWQPVGVAYVDANGSTQKTTSATAITRQADWDSGWYVVDQNVTISSRIQVNGRVHLILADGCKLTAKNGIIVLKGNTLTIYGQSKGNGQLEATGSGYTAGIGGAQYKESGTIIINGGRITARGSTAGGILWDQGGAGIGGGDRSGNGTVIINGGVVNAMGGGSSAGIGQGSPSSDVYKNNSTITINGGTVTATGRKGGAGIGGGGFNNGGSGIITITGGTVTAKGSEGALGDGSAGIGAGACANSSTITITGGTVTATGVSGGAGIGGGSDYVGIQDGVGGHGGTITITGGTVTANGSSNGAGIGGGRHGSCGTVTISGGKISATSASKGAGIGGGEGAKGGVVNISGGTVDARSAYSGAGIGGGENASGGDVTITGGVVYASGGTYTEGNLGDVLYRDAMGIGRGRKTDKNPSNGTLKLGNLIILYGSSTSEHPENSFINRIPYINDPQRMRYMTATLDTAQITTAPAAVEGLTYNGEAQALVSAGEAKNGTMEYALGADAETVPETDWSEAIPEAKDAGTYYVWSMAKGDGYHLDYVADAPVEVVVATKAVTVSGIAAMDKRYDGDTAAELDYSEVAFEGIVEGDALTVTATGAFEDAEPGTDKAVAISELTLGGESAANYALAEEGQQDSATASIVVITIAFDANGGEGEMDTAQPDENGDYELPVSGFTAPEGMEFAGWLIGEEVKQPGDSVTVTESMTAVAQWQASGQGAEAPVEEPTEAPVEEPTEAPVEEPAEESAEEPVEQPVEEPAEQPAEESVEQPAEEPVEQPVEEPGEQPAEEPVEQPVEEPAEQPAEESVEQPAEEPVEQPVEEAVEQPAEESVEQPVEEPAEQPAEEPVEQPVEEPVEQPTEESVEQPVEEPAEQPAEESVEQPAEEPVEEPVEQPAEEPVEEPVEQPVEAPADAQMCTITFDGGGADGEMAAVQVALGSEYAMPECAFYLEGCVFDAWQVDGALYHAGDVITVEGDMIAMASWLLDEGGEVEYGEEEIEYGGGEEAEAPADDGDNGLEIETEDVAEENIEEADEALSEEPSEVGSVFSGSGVAAIIAAVILMLAAGGIAVARKKK